MEGLPGSPLVKTLHVHHKALGFHAVWCSAPKETVEFCDSLPLQKETMDFFLPHHLAQGILVVSLPGIEPAPLAVKAQSYPWTNREVLKTVLEYSKWVTHH